MHGWVGSRDYRIVHRPRSRWPRSIIPFISHFSCAPFGPLSDARVRAEMWAVREKRVEIKERILVQHKGRARGGISQRNCRELPDAAKLGAQKSMSGPKPKMDHFICCYFAVHVIQYHACGDASGSRDLSLTRWSDNQSCGVTIYVTVRPEKGNPHLSCDATTEGGFGDITSHQMSRRCCRCRASCVAICDMFFYLLRRMH